MNIDPTRATILALHFEPDIVEPGWTFGALLADGDMLTHGIVTSEEFVGSLPGLSTRG